MAGLSENVRALWVKSVPTFIGSTSLHWVYPYGFPMYAGKGQALGKFAGNPAVHHELQAGDVLGFVGS